MSKSVMMKPSSGMCNMHCDYCFYCDEMQIRKQESYGFMSLDTLRNIIKKSVLNADGPVTIAFQGGEPTLRGLDFFKAAVQMEKQYNHAHVPITNAFQTNGMLLDEEWCQFFHDNHFLVGLSIDGIQSTHDAFRHTKDGKPVFERALHASELLDQYQAEYNILTVVNAQTAKHIQEIYHFYQEKGWKYQQYIPCLDGLNRKHGTDPWSLTPEVYGDFLVRLFDLWYEDWKNGRQPYIRQFENYISMLLGYAPEACDQRGNCGIQYVAEADGSCYPCDFYMLDEMKLGSFNLNTLKEMDAKRTEIGFLQESEKIAENCKKCKYYNLCRGGCQRNRDRMQDNLYQNYFCSAYQKFFEACTPKMTEVARYLYQRR